MISGGMPSFSLPSTSTVFSGNLKLGRHLDCAVCSRPTREYLLHTEECAGHHAHYCCVFTIFHIKGWHKLSCVQLAYCHPSAMNARGLRALRADLAAPGRKPTWLVCQLLL
eukprot:GHRR01035234.1.p1 GENE.GHRR01035234.1~~GHRR01035234.1.p1  ORF type:complete len:111 (-),score=9.85 GHRR01035234.1:79-411(-)